MPIVKNDLKPQGNQIFVFLGLFLVEDGKIPNLALYNFEKSAIIKKLFEILSALCKVHIR